MLSNKRVTLRPITPDMQKERLNYIDKDDGGRRDVISAWVVFYLLLLAAAVLNCLDKV